MIGDVLVCSILCNNLKKALPDAEIHYMIYATTSAVVEGNTSIDKLVLFTEKERKSKLAFYRFLMDIRNERYDVLIDSYSKLESWLTSYFSGARRKISYRKPGRNFLYTDLVNTYETPLTNLGLIIERRLSLLEPLNLDVQIDPVPKLIVSDQEKKLAQTLFRKHQVDAGRKTIMVSILGSSPIKTYPLNYMAKVLDFICKHSRVNVLFNYIPNQLSEAKSVFEACQPETQELIYFDLIGKSIREYIALMHACDLIIGNDGGAINMAKALNKPSFTIFSPWIRKEMWATFDDGIFHKSVHLAQYDLAHFEGKTEQELKKQSIDLYNYFKPTYFFDELSAFLEDNVSKNTQFDLSTNIKPISTQRLPVSVLVIVKNELNNLPALLRNLDFTTELIVVDSMSTDGTEEFIKGHSNVRFIKKAFNNFSEQRNFAIDQASHDWVLFVDADERIPQSLQHEIRSVMSSDEKHVAYEVYRQFFFVDIPLNYGGFQTDRVVRFFDKSKARYNSSKLVHETLAIQGSTGRLKSKILHFSYTNRKSYQAKLDRYAQLRALELKKKDMRPNFFHTHLKPAYRFFYHYILRRGFLDGKPGTTMAALQAYGVKQRYSVLKRLSNQP